MKAMLVKLSLAIFCLGIIGSSFGFTSANAQGTDVSTIYVYYSHLDGFNVKPGDYVNIGDVVGYAGTSGFMLVKATHLHLAMGIFPPDVEAARVDSVTSKNTDWVDPGWVLSTYGFSYQPGTRVCGAAFGAPNPDGKQAFHNATDHCGYKKDDPVTAIMPGKVVWTKWWPPSREARDSGHGKVVVVQVDLNAPIKQDSSVPQYTIQSYADLGEFVLDATPVPTAIPSQTPVKEAPVSKSNNIFIIVAGLFLFGGLMLILAVTGKKFWLFLLVVGVLMAGFVAYKAYTKPHAVSGTSSEVTFGTGGEQMEYEWNDPALDLVVKNELASPPIVQDGGDSISPVFYKFAVGQLWGKEIPIWAKLKGLDPDVVATFILVESGGNPLAHCPGDKLGYRGKSDDRRDHGLFQLNPTYFENGCNMDNNIREGTGYIASRIIAAKGNLAAAAAGYNGGPMALQWFLVSSDPNSPEYKKARNGYIVFLNAHGYNGPAKAAIVETYVSRILGVYNAAKTNSTSGLEPFLSQGSYAGSVAKAYGLPWPPANP